MSTVYFLSIPPLGCSHELERKLNEKVLDFGKEHCKYN